MHGCPKVLILLVDIDTPVNEDFCDEDIVVPSALKDRKETRAIRSDANITDSWNMTGEDQTASSISRETKGKDRRQTAGEIWTADSGMKKVNRGRYFKN